MEDRTIVDLYWNRDETAIAETDKKYGPYCLSVALRVVNDRPDAEECVNDTWLRAWNAMPPQRPLLLRPFLAKITRNLALDRYRAHSAAKRGSGETDAVLEELEGVLSGGSDPEQEVTAKELQEAIGKFVKGLPDRERDVFIRRYFYAESTPDIAERYGLKEPSVRTILARTRNRMKEFLEKEGFLG